jgi:hypothetical protein
MKRKNRMTRAQKEAKQLKPSGASRYGRKKAYLDSHTVLIDGVPCRPFGFQILHKPWGGCPDDRVNMASPLKIGEAVSNESLTKGVV